MVLLVSMYAQNIQFGWKLSEKKFSIIFIYVVLESQLNLKKTPECFKKIQPGLIKLSFFLDGEVFEMVGNGWK